jgi:hypothetical protein
MIRLMLLRLAYLAITNAVAPLRLLPGGDRDKDIEILTLRHQLAVLRRQRGGQHVRFEQIDRAWLAAMSHPLPRPTLRRLRLLVRPFTGTQSSCLMNCGPTVDERVDLLAAPLRPLVKFALP